jgi:hypothetical protein
MYQRRSGCPKVAARITRRVFGNKTSTLDRVRIERNYVRILRTEQVFIADFIADC